MLLLFALDIVDSVRCLEELYEAYEVVVSKWGKTEALLMDVDQLGLS